MKNKEVQQIKASILLTKEENKKLKEIAYQDERSLRYILQKCVREFIERNEESDL